MARFSGKRVLITGGTSGIGLAGARGIVADGGEVVVTGTSRLHMEDTRKALPHAVVLRNDASDPTAAAELAAAVEPMGGLDGIWLNAGFAAEAPIEEVDAAFVDRLMNTNVRGPILQMAALAGLLREGASVLLTSATAAYEGAPLASVYAASKGALIAAARCWATALAPRAIRVNVLVPGPIDTGLREGLRELLSADGENRFDSAVISRIPLRRVGTPAEAAAVALFLLSDEAAYVTGAQYAVDGGLTLR